MIRIRRLSSNSSGSSSSTDYEERNKTPEKSSILAFISEYPLEKFPNWSLTPGDRYYVYAPIDRLGEFAFHLRSHLTALILSGNPAIEYLQQRRSPALTVMALVFSRLGLEEFFFSLVASVMWLFDAKLGRLLAAVLALGFYISSFVKVLLCLPRPPSPPAIRLSEEDGDWAWPSNHALVGTVFPWFIWIYACAHYELSFQSSFLLLFAVMLWNGGVIWSRVYLGVHSPCDIAGGWVIGVVLLFIFSGFSDRLYDFYVVASHNAPWKLSYFAVFTLFAFYIHPRAWPETDSFGDMVCVMSGAFVGVLSSRALHIGGEAPPLSLAEASSDAHFIQFVLRFVVGCTATGAVRLLTKPFIKSLINSAYKSLGLYHYSFSAMCKAAPVLPDKRYTSKMRFRPIAGKPFAPEEIPFNTDLPVKFIVYTMTGVMVGEGCPTIFSLLHI